MQVLIFLFLGALIAMPSHGQESRYQITDLADITQQWNSITKDYSPGISIFEKPQFVTLQLRVVKLPYRCSPGMLRLVGRTMKLKIPIMREDYCGDFVSEPRGELTLHINPNALDKLNATLVGTDLTISAQLLAFIVETDKTRNTLFAYLDDVRIK